MIVKALMSTSEFPSPSRAIIRSTAPSSGQATTRSSGADQSSTPKPKSTARRPRVASTRARNPPISPPMPSTASRSPTLASSMSRRSRAIATLNTSEAPATTVCAQ